MATELGPGTLLADRFRLEDLLEDSSGARLWRATDQTLARDVAVHVVPAEDARAQAVLTAARTAATIPDGHLLRVLDADAMNGVVYVVQEWGSGVSLDRLLQDGPLGSRRAAWVAMEVAMAVSVAHRHGIAHGRLLPENVMITDTGAVKLIGFVIDAVLRGDSGRDDRDSAGQETDAGGSAEHDADARQADVVNLGALLYAGLVGRWPGTPGSAVPPAPREHGRALRPRRVRAGVPRVLDALCDRVLNTAQDGPAAGIQTAHEVYAALADFAGEPGGSTIEQRSASAPDGTAPAQPDTAEAGEPTQLQPMADTADPEATRPGVPLFHEGDSGVGWVTAPQERGIGSSADDERGAATPPPELPEPKPLFAPEPADRPAKPNPPEEPALTLRQQPGTTNLWTRTTQLGNRELPPAWGPDANAAAAADDGESDGTGRERRAAGRPWLRVAAVVAAVVVLVVVGVVLAFNLGHGPAPTAATSQRPTVTSASPAAAHTRLHISAVTDFDPEASPPTENPAEAPLAIDGDPTTAWQTVTYYGSPQLGNLKSGVGLLVDLGSPQRLSQVHLTLVGSPTSLQILADPGAVSAPASTDGMRVVGAAQDAGQDVTVNLTQPVTTRWFAVWLTSLPPVASGGYRGAIAEISARS